jgi:RNA polymerase sigma factor (sigma-70 family)
VTALPPFQALLDEHAADVMAVLRGAVGRTDAEDCFQETFLAALRAYPRLGDARNLRGWLLTIAHRKAIDHHRANGRRPVPAGDAEQIKADGTNGPGSGRPRRGGAPVGGADRVERDVVAADGIWELVGALPPKQRAAVALRYGSDLPHAEIATALGCSPEAARRSLHEGIKRLRAELGTPAGGKEGP